MFGEKRGRYTGFCHGADDVVGVAHCEGRGGECVPEACAVDGVDLRYAEQDWGAVYQGCGEGRAVVGLHCCVEREHGVVDVYDVLFDCLACGKDDLGDREGEGGGEEGNEGEEMHCVVFAFGGCNG